MLLTRFIIIEEGQLSLCEILTLKYLLLRETNTAKYVQRTVEFYGGAIILHRKNFMTTSVFHSFSTHFTCTGTINTYGICSVKSLANQAEVSVTGVWKHGKVRMNVVNCWKFVTDIDVKSNMVF